MREEEGGASLGGRAAGRGDFSAPARGSEKEGGFEGRGRRRTPGEGRRGEVCRAQRGWERGALPLPKIPTAGGSCRLGRAGRGPGRADGGFGALGNGGEGQGRGRGRGRGRSKRERGKGKGAQKESRSGRCPETGSLVGPILLAGVCPDGVYWSSSPSPSKRSMGDSALNLLTAAVALLMGCRVPGPATQPPTQAIPSIR
ncbi:hypothetical protein SAMN05444424_1796 [Bittarella massiliensis (ex Durand et al. 2017)]|uniref:Uncharacterized protein n=1 Tax=Bittarella massiliensis (ex Durand et al. 2017) TaxID=1720313 RepID=A0AAQ1ME20_9FIRM|nr:hypothetical protein SAMN05444424_1796 [Bittarella massiliensis (ex Durand et al. 2017)]